MKKLLTGLLMLLAIVGTAGISAYAGDINSAESTLIGVVSGTYEKDGYYWAVDPYYIEKGCKYLERDDVDLTDADVAGYIDSFYGSIGDPEYFIIVGQVENKNPDPNPAPEPTEPPVDETPTSPEVKDPEPGTGNEPVDEVEEAPIEDVSFNDVSENDDEVLDETDVSANEIIKIDNITSVSEEVEDTWQPAKDYSDAGNIKKQFPIGIVAAIIIAITAIASVVALVIHKKKTDKRFK